jgi:hypothetical protein
VVEESWENYILEKKAEEAGRRLKSLLVGDPKPTLLLFEDGVSFFYVQNQQRVSSFLLLEWLF